jgi:protein-S-isoprenylcysteine O-methyltransferase
MKTAAIIFFAIAMASTLTVEFYLSVREKGKIDSALDGGSLKLICHMRNLSFAVGIASCFYPVVPLPGSVAVHFATGGALVSCAFVLRVWAIVKLGKYFTSVVMTREDQKIATDGLYRYIRHPAYTGAMLFYLGFGIAMGSLPGAAVIMSAMFIGFHRRMAVEEHALVSAFGDVYADYMTRTKRLIPFVY